MQKRTENWDVEGLMIELTSENLKKLNKETIRRLLTLDLTEADRKLLDNEYVNKPTGRPKILKNPPKSKKKVYHHKCRWCHKEWDSMKEKPLLCGLCKTRNWQEKTNTNH